VVLSDPVKKSSYDSSIREFVFDESIDVNNLFERELGKLTIFGNYEGKGSMLSDSGFSLNFDNDIDKYQEIKRKIIENIKKNASE